MRRYRLASFLTIFFLTILQVEEVIVPLFYKKFFDILAQSGGIPTSSFAQRLIAVLLTILAIQGSIWAFRRLSQFALVYLQPRVMTDLVQTSFNYMLGHSYSFFSNNFTGSLVRRVNRLSKSFETIIDRMFFDFIPLVINIIGVTIVLFYRNQKLGTIFLIWVMVFVTAQYKITSWKQKFNLRASEKDSETTGVLSDAISNDLTIKLFSAHKHELSLVQKVSEELRKARSKIWTIDEWINLMQSGLMIGIEFILLFTAVKLWQQKILTVGDFALIQAYLINAVWRLWNLGNMLRRIYEALADATEMTDILNTPHEIQDKPIARTLRVTEGKIEFQNIDFSFRQTRKILENFQLTIRGGEKVALIGPSGAGKTTVVKLLLRLHELDKSKITIDGQNIADVTQESLRKNIAFVPQEPILFHRPLLENIRYGRLDATNEEVMEASRQAHCHEFIGKLQDQYQTFVGERGIKLSGGERQRVAIARAILKNAPILVLDEATSSLDSESEHFIQQALEVLMKDKTVIAIAHRLSTIMKMDRIIVIDQGEITAEGTHQELISQPNGLYKKLWEIQAGGFLK